MSLSYNESVSLQLPENFARMMASRLTSEPRKTKLMEEHIKAILNGDSSKLQSTLTRLWLHQEKNSSDEFSFYVDEELD